jgi:hypothetical protein
MPPMNVPQMPRIWTCIQAPTGKSVESSAELPTT